MCRRSRRGVLCLGGAVLGSALAGCVSAPTEASDGTMPALGTPTGATTCARQFGEFERPETITRRTANYTVRLLERVYHRNVARGNPDNVLDSFDFEAETTTIEEIEGGYAVTFDVSVMATDDDGDGETEPGGHRRYAFDDTVTYRLTDHGVTRGTRAVCSW